METLIVIVDLAVAFVTLTAAVSTARGTLPDRWMYPAFITASAVCVVATVVMLGGFLHIIPTVSLGFWGGGYIIRRKRQI